MSDSPGEGGDFFSRIPLFREFARLLSGEPGPVNWELARQVAVATAIGADTLGAPALPVPKFSPEPGEQRAWDDNLRLAELWVDPVSSLPGPGQPLIAQPTSRADWAETALRSLRPLVEPGASRMADALGPGAGGGVPPEMGQMVGRLGGLIVGLQVGTVVGQLSHLVLSGYDLPLPPAGDSGRLVFLSENVSEFERSIGLPRDQLRLWLACHEVVSQRLLTGVPWLADHLTGLVREMASLTDPDPSGLMDRLQGLDMSRPESLQELLEGGEELTGPPSPALDAATARLEVLLALAAGYPLVLSERVLSGRLPALQSIQAAIRMRLADDDGAHALYTQLLRANPERAGAGRGERFCREVLAATDVDGLDRVWAHPDFLPTPEELGAPGRWLERVGLVGGEEVSLDEGLRALLAGEMPPGPNEPGSGGGESEGRRKPDEPPERGEGPGGAEGPGGPEGPTR